MFDVGRRVLSQPYFGGELDDHGTSISSNFMPVSEFSAAFPVSFCHRRIIVSQYSGSNSSTRACRPVFSAAISVVPDPANGSRIICRRLEQSLMASALMTQSCPRRPRRADSPTLCAPEPGSETSSFPQIVLISHLAFDSVVHSQDGKRILFAVLKRT